VTETGTCVRCGRDYRRAARGLCDACYAWATYHGCREDYPRRIGRLSDLVEDVAFLRQQGESWEAVAARLGSTPAAVRRQMLRARRQGLVA